MTSGIRARFEDMESALEARMEGKELIVAKMRKRHETMKFGIKEPRSGGDGVREEMKTVSNSTVDLVHKNIENEARGELQRSTQKRTFKEILAMLRDKKEKLPWKWECYFCEGEHRSSECPQRLILHARIKKLEDEEGQTKRNGMTQTKEEDEEIGLTQVPMEDAGSEPHLIDVDRMEEGPTVEGDVLMETKAEEGLITGGAITRDTQLILVENQDRLHDGRETQLIVVEDQDMMNYELPPKKKEEEGLTT